MNTERKLRQKLTDLRGETVEFDGENWRDDRSTPITQDLWTKTTKNATNPEIQIRAIFWGKHFGGIFGRIGGIGGSNPWQPLL
jgi:hypothetical protein